MNESKDFYSGREQTWVKHYILKTYLDRFTHIIGSKWDSITYIDGFSGPWNAQSENFDDSSFAIALSELKKARNTYRETQGREISLRCFFVEKDQAAFSKLQEFAAKEKDVDIKLLKLDFEDAIDETVKFIHDSQKKTFSFIFIDPTGWTGFQMDKISPLLKQRPSEVLINFMTGHILRFIDNDYSEAGFHGLFGNMKFKQEIQGLQGEDRIDAIINEYCSNLKKTCNFEFACPAIVLNPQQNRPHFHLIYATRSPKGVEVFKEVEKKAMGEMEKKRLDLEKKQGKWTLPFGEDDTESNYYIKWRKRYLEKAKANTLKELQHNVSIPYDTLWIKALTFPLVWESDLKEWIKVWQKQNKLKIHGLGDRERVVKRSRNHRLSWIT